MLSGSDYSKGAFQVGDSDAMFATRGKIDDDQFISGCHPLLEVTCDALG
jgi:hypothetical protein